MKTRREFLVVTGLGAIAASGFISGCAASAPPSNNAFPHGHQDGAGHTDAYDYVIVGAGAAGAVLAHELSLLTNATVAVIEAGGIIGENDLSRSQGGFFLTWGGERDWAYATTEQSALGGRVVPQPRGKAVGGSTTLNIGAWLRGRLEDIDAWELSGATGWNGESARQAYVAIERTDRGPRTLRGADGLVVLNDIPSASPISGAMLDAYTEAGLGQRGDSNGAGPFVADHFQTIFQDGARRSLGDAFLGDAQAQPNLTLITDTFALRVLIEDGRAVGVLVEKADGTVATISARREVVLAGGAFNTPQLLMLSGIGPAEHLTEHGIEVKANLPAVGASLRDHVMVPVGTLAAAGVKGSMPPDFGEEQIKRWVTHREGALTYFPGTGVGWASKTGTGLPDYELLFQYNPDAKLFPSVEDADTRSGSLTNVVLLQPRSTGTVRLSSADPHDPVLIDPGYLTDPADVKDLIDGVRIAQRLARTEALTPYAEHVAPALEASDADIERHVRATASSTFHASGTVRMGAADDPRAALTPDLAVKGIDGLRVADASIMPNLVRGHTMAASAYIGYRAARLIASTSTSHAYTEQAAES